MWQVLIACVMPPEISATWTCFYNAAWDDWEPTARYDPEIGLGGQRAWVAA
jgi:hypothetical protein